MGERASSNFASGRSDLRLPSLCLHKETIRIICFGWRSCWSKAMAASRHPVEELDPDVLACLSGVTDPEIGLSIVDLGLIYRARNGPQGLDVALTLTSPACPLGELIADNVRAQLACRFPAAPDIAVALVWDPAWTPDRISGQSRERLGLLAKVAL